MITFDQAVAQIDPNTGLPDVRPGSLFDQYTKQQANNQGTIRSMELSPELQYMQANPDVLQFAADTARSEGIAPGADFGARTSQIAQQHFIEHGQPEGRHHFDMVDSLGRPLSNFHNGVFQGTTPIDTMPFNPTIVTMPGSSISGDTTTADTSTVPTMTGPTNFAPAPLPGQLPGYSFTADPNQYARTLGNFGGLLNDTSPFYAGQVPVAPPVSTAPTGGFNFPELQNYPNANYSAGAFPIIYTY